MKRFDLTVWLGIGVGLAAIITGAWLDGLNLAFLWHPTAALVVFGGTLGAVIVRRGTSGVVGAIGAVWRLRMKSGKQADHDLELGRLAWLARSAQKNGIKAYENFADTCKDPLIARGLIMVADHTGQDHVEQVLKRQLSIENDHGLQDPGTLEAAGGFAPTFGIIGAVLGLISVLRVIDRPDVLGVGIATAFVATLYGIGLANLVFFPLAARLRIQHEARMRHREQVLDIILALASRETTGAIINRFDLKR